MNAVPSVRAIGRALIALMLASSPMVAAPASKADSSQEARFSRAMSRCAKLSELISCDEALNMKPNDPGLLIAEADALVQLKRPGEAIGVYRNALRLAANQNVVNPKIALAQSQRLSLLDTCEGQFGEVAERACEAAWLPGAPDEVALFKRRGLLLKANNKPSPALDAFMAAARLRPRDRGVAQAIVTLSGNTGRKDSLTLMARGTALMTLGHPLEAAASFRQAVRLSPNLAEAKARLRVAERAAEAASPPAGAAVADADPGNSPIHPYTNNAPVTRSN